MKKFYGIDNFSNDTLELNKILFMLAEKTACDDAYDKAINLHPTADIQEVRKRLNETISAYDLQNRFGSPSFSGLVDISEKLEFVKNGGSLLPTDLLKVAMVLRSFIQIISWKKQSLDFKTHIDYLFNKLYENKYLSQKISDCILSEDEISDSASIELMNIRRKIKSVSSKIREKLDQIIHSSTYRKYLQEPIITIRNDRFVIPVKSECRAFVNGLVHDTSASGATIFVEPISVLEMNNDIRVLKSQEKNEIDKILKKLSEEIAQVADNILNSYKVAVEINLVFAKSDLAYDMKASVPKLNEKGIINLKKARHPLINKKDVVPIDIQIGEKFDTLIITGPNTGGKTVCLKTVGLLTLMTMCGLMIPANDNSEIGIFENIFCDIGDEQSIEQSLSTFSSHITNIVKIQKFATEKSLILLDELGAGTDPIEGAALAVSIIEDIRSKGSKVLATTHYPELKSFAINTVGVQNASCEFDVKTLQPTYKLTIGMPGKSNAFAICKHLKLPENIINRADELISCENRSFEDVIESLEKTKQELEAEKQKAQSMRVNATKEKKKATDIKQKLQKEYNREIQKAREKAQRILSSIEADAEELLSELTEMRKNKNKITDSQKIKLKSQLKKLQEETDPVEIKKEENYKLPVKLKKGDNVLIIDLDKKAVVLEDQNKDKTILVKAGIIKTRVKLSNLKLLSEEKIKINTNTSKVTKHVNQKSVSTEIDLRGQNAIDAINELDVFIDSSLMMNIKNFTVIHGKGEGILRKEVAKFLKKNKFVKNFRLGVFGEGESGVTIVELK